MKKIIFYLSIFIFSCSSNETNEVINKISFKKVNYITLTNETNDGGSQKAYLVSGISVDQAEFCFCDVNCTREIFVVSELEFNSDSTNFRYKKEIDDTFITKSSRDWCTKVK
jgi:hypothetical protein